MSQSMTTVTACLYDPTIPVYTACEAMRKRSEVLKYVVERWKEDFTGTSALQVARRFRLTHPEAIRRLRILARRGAVRLRNAPLGRPTQFREYRTEQGQVLRFPIDWEMVDTVVAFPERRVLAEVFVEDARDYGIFTNRLHKGDSCLSHYFFRQDVLDRYFQHPERYLIQDTVVGGHLLTRDTYYLSLPQGRRDKDTFGQVTYGKRRLKNGGVAVAVICLDLSRLPYQEQQYWASHELEPGTGFVEDDPEFEKYYRSTFLAQAVSYEDPLQELGHVVERLNNLANAIAGGKLFRNSPDNPHLRYAVTNTVKAYQDAHEELYKLLGTDSLDKDVLLGLLKEVGGTEDELRRPRSGAMKAWELFKLLVGRYCKADFAPLERCHDSRVAAAHKVQSTDLPSGDLTFTFRIDCAGILDTLKSVESCLVKALER